MESAEVYQGFYLKKYHDYVSCSFAYKVACIDGRFSKPIVVFRGENADYEFVKAFLKEYCKKLIKKHENHEWRRKIFISTK